MVGTALGTLTMDYKNGFEITDAELLRTDRLDESSFAPNYCPRCFDFAGTYDPLWFSSEQDNFDKSSYVKYHTSSVKGINHFKVLLTR